MHQGMSPCLLQHQRNAANAAACLLIYRILLTRKDTLHIPVDMDHPTPVRRQVERAEQC